MLAAVVIMCSLVNPPDCYPQQVFPATCNGDMSFIENPIEIDNTIYVPTEMIWCDPHALIWVAQQDDEVAVLDAWGVVMDRFTRVKNIIEKSYMHRDYDRELMKRVRDQMAEINIYLDNIDKRIKW